MQGAVGLVAVLLVLTSVSLVPGRALAQTTVELEPESGAAGSAITLSGCLESFKGGESVVAHFDGTIEVARATLGDDGCFTASGRVPSEASPGEHQVHVEPDVGIVTFTVEGTAPLQPTAQVSPPDGVPGRDVTITGCDWQPGGDVDLVWRSTGALLASAEVPPDGCVALTLTVPLDAAEGEHELLVHDVANRLGVELAFVVEPTTAAGPSAEFTWDRPEQLRQKDERGLGDGIRTPAELAAMPHVVEFDACGSSPAADIVAYRWQFVPADPTLGDSLHPDEWRQQVVADGCELTWEAPAEGLWDVTLRAVDEDGDVGVVTETVRVWDLFIVSLGDSYSSGEGNPDHVGEYVVGDLGAIDSEATWTNRRCHRSRFGWPYLLARGLEEQFPAPTSVAYVGLSCSGATIEKLFGEAGGVLDPYVGTIPPELVARHGDVDVGAPLAPQVDQLEDYMAAAGRAPDYVFMSAGGNDIGFSSIIKDCLLFGCSERDLRASFPVGVEAMLIGLEDRYDRLAARLEEIGVPAGRVHILEYPDLTRDGYGEFDSCYWATTNRDFEWAHDKVLVPLNTKVREAADRHGWTLLGGTMEATGKHGICAGADWLNWDVDALAEGHTSWFRDIEDSFDYQGDELGGFHPNRAGHRALASQASTSLVHPVFTPNQDGLDVQGRDADGNEFALSSGFAFTDELTVTFSHDNPDVEIDASLNGQPFQSGTTLTPGEGHYTAYRLSVRPRLPETDVSGAVALPERIYRFAVREELPRGGILDTVELSIEYQGRRHQLDHYPRLGSWRRGGTSAPSELGVFLNEVAVHAASSDPAVEVSLQLEETGPAWVRADDPASRALASGETIRSDAEDDEDADFHRLVVSATLAGRTEQVGLPIAVADSHLPVRQSVSLAKSHPNDLGRQVQDLWYRYDPGRGGWLVDGNANESLHTFRGSLTPIVRRHSRLARDVRLEVDGVPHPEGRPVTEVGDHTLSLYVCMNVLGDCDAPTDGGLGPHRVAVSRDGPIDFEILAADPVEQALADREIPPRPEDCSQDCIFDDIEGRWRELTEEERQRVYAGVASDIIAQLQERVDFEATGGTGQAEDEPGGTSTPTPTSTPAESTPESSPSPSASAPGDQGLLGWTDAIAGDNLGSSVDTDGQTIVAGAPGRDEGAGAAVVYERSGDDVEQVAVLFPPSPSPGARFGHDVGVDDDVIAVSAPFASPPAVHVYERSPEGWRHVSTHEEPAGSPGGFGLALAVDSATVVVGAAGSTEAAAGRAYVYAPPQGAPWGLVGELSEPDGGTSTRFGEDVDVDETTIVVGAPARAGGPGTAHVFEDAAGYRHVTELTPSDGRGDAGFGSAVAVSVDPQNFRVAVTVGAPRHDEAGEDAGMTYRYDRDEQGDWRESARRGTQASDRVAGARFGASVDMAGPATHVVGAPTAGDDAGFVELGLPDDIRIVEAPADVGRVLGGSVAVAQELAVAGVPRAFGDRGGILLLPLP